MKDVWTCERLSGDALAISRSGWGELLHAAGVGGLELKKGWFFLVVIQAPGTSVGASFIPLHAHHESSGVVAYPCRQKSLLLLK